MNKNEKSLIEHALKLYGFNREYKSDSCYKFINVYDQDQSPMFTIYKNIGTDDFHYGRVSNKPLNPNIRSFVEHWMRYYDFNEQISYVMVDKHIDNIYEISVICIIHVPYRYSVIIPQNTRDGFGPIAYNW